MSATYAEYVRDMQEAIMILKNWVDWVPSLQKAIEIIQKTVEWDKEALESLK